jgi:hypothetical protein
MDLTVSFPELNNISYSRAIQLKRYIDILVEEVNNAK